MNWLNKIFISGLFVIIGQYTMYTMAKPEQIHMAQGKTPESMVISWVSGSNFTPQVIYGYTPQRLNQKVTGQSKNYTFNNYTSGQISHVELTGLSPSTRYYYQCGDFIGNPSEIASFTTGPKIGDTTPMTFGVIGDIGQTPDTEKTLAHLHKSHQLDMILHAGDLAYADCVQELWDSYGRLIEPVSKSISWMVGPGNHEIEVSSDNQLFKAFESRYRMPAFEPAEFGQVIISSAINPYTKQPYCSPSQFLAEYNYGNSFYSFDIGIAHVVYLNSYTPSDTNSAQYSWLVSDLDKINRTELPWIIVVMHCPWYNSNTAHQNEKQTLLMKETIEDVFYKYKVNLVITGHVHAYERTYPVYANEINKLGPTYITIGDGGNIEGHATGYQYPQPAWSAFRNGTQYGYGTLSIDNFNSMQWKWYRNMDSEWVFKDQVQIDNLF